MQLRALYRTYLRTAHRLPHLYLRQFFQIRARDDVDAIAAIAEPLRRNRKIHDVARRVRRLEKATQRDVKAFQRVLNLAYGRTGKLRWELLHPILTDPSTPPPPPIIPALPRTAPPVYSPELKRLLTIPTLKHKKPFTHAELTNPRLLPARVDPTSPDALLFGPLSKRREANLRKRAYDLTLKRVMPPLEVVVNNDQGMSGTATQALDAVRTNVYPRPLGMQDLGVMRDINDIIGNMISIPLPMPRRARRAAALNEAAPTSPEKISSEPSIQDHAGQGPSMPNQIPPDQAHMHPFRWVRRRYRTLLASLPQLTYNVTHFPGGVRGSFDVDTPALSISYNHKTTHYNPPADAVSLAWIAFKSVSPKKGNLNKDSGSGSKTESKSASNAKERQDQNTHRFVRKEANAENSAAPDSDKETQGHELSS